MVYSSGTSTSPNPTVTGTIAVTPGVEYVVQMEVLRNDLSDPSEKVAAVTLDGAAIGGCNPDGGDYDCTFCECVIPKHVIKSSVSRHARTCTHARTHARTHTNLQTSCTRANSRLVRSMSS